MSNLFVFFETKYLLNDWFWHLSFQKTKDWKKCLTHKNDFTPRRTRAPRSEVENGSLIASKELSTSPRRNETCLSKNIRPNMI